MKLRLTLAAAFFLTGCGATHSLTSANAPQGANFGARAAITNPSVLQKHVMFFDTNHDGILKLNETKDGLKRLGLGNVTGFGAAAAIHLGLRAASAGGTDLDIAKIHATKHGGDSGAIDAEGRFVPKAFERIMSFDANHSGSLSWTELKKMMGANSTSGKPVGASVAEFGLLLKLGADTTETEGKEKVDALSEARLKSVYTGTVFEGIARERAKKGAKAELVDGPLPE